MQDSSPCLFADFSQRKKHDRAHRECGGGIFLGAGAEKMNLKSSLMWAEHLWIFHTSEGRERERGAIDTNEGKKNEM